MIRANQDQFHHSSVVAAGPPQLGHSSLVPFPCKVYLSPHCFMDVGDRVALIDVQDVNLAFGGPSLLERITFQLDPGERVCLVGRNGTGKSTLLKLLAGNLLPDDGRIHRQLGLRVAYVQQEVPAAASGTVGELAAVRAEGPEHEEDWEWRRRIEVVLDGLGLDENELFASLSGGLKRRVFLARALISKPDLLLLDEPTNHLDIKAITWMEEYLLQSSASLLFVTHDRAFLQRIATRIIELDRGQLASFPGNYKTYLSRKEQVLAAEENQRANFDKKLAQEEAWIRQGIKARRTRNEGRVRALLKLRLEKQAQRQRIGSVQMKIHEAERSGKLVLDAKNIHFAYDETPIVKGLSIRVLRGDRIGLIGPNGVGKTTLLKLLLGELQPQQGEVELGTKLQVAYLDQLRGTLREDDTVAQNLADGSDNIFVGDKAKHVITYLREFLFAPERARSPVSVLSGGERNRLLLARLFAQPSNLLVLDEPTNDLDTETLELLEERLMDYQGTVLLVSHDRTFLNNLVTSTLAFSGNGDVQEYVGGYDDWMRQVQAEQAPTDSPKKQKTKHKRTSSQTNRPRKLKFAEKRELEELPARIEALDAELETLRSAMASPQFYQQDKDTIATAVARLDELDSELETVYARWEELEAIAEAAQK